MTRFMRVLALLGTFAASSHAYGMRSVIDAKAFFDGITGRYTIEEVDGHVPEPENALAIVDSADPAELFMGMPAACKPGEVCDPGYILLPWDQLTVTQTTEADGAVKSVIEADDGTNAKIYHWIDAAGKITFVNFQYKGTRTEHHLVSAATPPAPAPTPIDAKTFFDGIQGRYTIETVNGVVPDAADAVAVVDSSDPTEMVLGMPTPCKPGEICDSGFLLMPWNQITVTQSTQSGAVLSVIEVNDGSATKVFHWIDASGKITFVNFQYKGARSEHHLVKNQ